MATSIYVVTPGLVPEQPPCQCETCTRAVRRRHEAEERRQQAWADALRRSAILQEQVRAEYLALSEMPDY
jgi:hypothetical protein